MSDDALGGRPYNGEGETAKFNEDDEVRPAAGGGFMDVMREKTQALLCEFVGSTMFGTIFMVTMYNKNQNDQSIPLGIGAAYLCVVFIGLNVSGGHYNPAVTLGYYVSQVSMANGCVQCIKDVFAGWVMMVLYMGVQTAGYFLSTIIARLIVGKKDFIPYLNQYCEDPGDKDGAEDCMRVVFAEICVTFVLVTVVICATSKPGIDFAANFNKPEMGAAALTIGFAMISGIAMAGTLSMALLNPGLTIGVWFGQDAFNKDNYKQDYDEINQMWVNDGKFGKSPFSVVLYYIIAQFIGGVAAGLLAITGITGSH